MRHLNFSGPAPGCPAQSVNKRRWINHNSCGSYVDPEDPEYYGTPDAFNHQEDYKFTVYDPPAPRDEGFVFVRGVAGECDGGDDRTTFPGRDPTIPGMNFLSTVATPSIG